MSGFDLEKFKEKLLGLVDGDEVHPMNLKLVVSVLINDPELQKFLSDKKIDVKKLGKLLNNELQDDQAASARLAEHHGDNKTTERFEHTQHKTDRSFKMQEEVHMLVNAVQMRQILNDASEIKAEDVLKEAVLMNMSGQSHGHRHHPMQSLMSMAIGEPANNNKIRAFELMKIDPFALFPEIEKEARAFTAKIMKEGGDGLVEYLGSLAAALEDKYPGTTKQFLGLLSGDSQDRTVVRGFAAGVPRGRL